MISLLRLIYLSFIFGKIWIFRHQYKDQYIFGLRVAKLLESLGPSFIKLGQTISTRPDIVGYDFANAMGKLQDSLSPFPAKQVKEILKKDFGKEAEQLFKEFDFTPVAAASVAQVHRAKTFDGKDVAVKILRPNVVKKFQRDVRFFKWVAKLLERYVKSTRRLKPISVVKTFEEYMKIELDLRMEASAASELKENLKNDSGVIIPEIFWGTTSKSVLTMQWMNGISIHDIEKIKANNLCTEKIAANLAISFFNQAFRDGFFHGDMHPGNVFVDMDHNIILVDFGIMGRLDKETRLYFAQILKGFLDRNYFKVAEVHFEAGYVPKTQNVHYFAQACRAIGEPIIGMPSNQIYIGKLIALLFDIARDFKMETQTQLILLQKSMVLIEGVGSMLDPNVNLWKLAEPWIEDWYIKNLGVEAKLFDWVKAIILLIYKWPRKQSYNNLTV